MKSFKFKAVPWLLVLAAIRVLYEHWQRVEERDRRRAAEILKRSKGLPHKMDQKERRDIVDIAKRVDHYRARPRPRRRRDAVPGARAEVAQAVQELSTPRCGAPRRLRPPVTDDPKAKTRFDPAEAEPRLMRRWLDSGLFHSEAEGTAAENFSIAIPPPNVTGALHMGHALNGSIQDVLTRTNRMRGRHTRWTLGTDHAGIATQKQVEKRLDRAGHARARRSAARRSSSRSGSGAASSAARSSSSSSASAPRCDYTRERFTLDEGYAKAVQKVFVDLYADGLIYRDYYMVNWDPGSRSAISDLEVEDREVTDTLYEIAYPLADGDGEVVVATVRPETMLADTAVAVNPDDERFSAPRGPHRDAAARRPHAAGDRRRLREDRLRHRLPEDHARATTRTTSRSAAATASARSPSSARTGG